MSFTKNTIFLLLITAALVSTAFAVPGGVERFYRTDHWTTAETGIASIELLPNGNPIFFGWERVKVGRQTLSKPIIRRVVVDYQPLPASVGCVRALEPMWGEFTASTVQPDGKYLLTGFTIDRYAPNFRKVLVIRCNQDLSLDTSFGSGGILRTQFSQGGAGTGYKVFTRPDGRIVVAGVDSIGAGAFRFGVIQLNPDGSPDSTFGDGGMIVLDLPLERQEISAALQTDGKLVIGGTGSGLEFTLLRINPDGSQDLSFGSGQPVRTSIGLQGTSLADIKIQTDGRIVANGTAFGTTDSDLALARYNSDGSVDTTFGLAGIVVTDHTLNERAHALEIQPNGKIIVGGQNRPTGSAGNWTTARYFPNGTIDRGFGRGGFSGIDTPNAIHVSACYSLKVLTNGKFLLAGINTLMPFAALLSAGERNSTIKFDFDGDGRSDFGYFDPADSYWNFSYSSGGVSRTKWGLPSDSLAPADYDGDGKTNLAVFRDGQWYILMPDGTFYTESFGQAGDLPRPGDFDGDGKADLAIFRPSNGLWRWKQSSDSDVQQRHFGMAGDIPLIADFGGVGFTTPVLFRPSEGRWYRIGRNLPMEIFSFRFGMEGDIPFTGDFDGDKISDYTVYRPSTAMWYRYSTYTSEIINHHFGTEGDIPVAGDYNGDGISEIAVYRPSTGTWYVFHPDNGFTSFDFGSEGVKPLTSVY